MTASWLALAGFSICGAGMGFAAYELLLHMSGFSKWKASSSRLASRAKGEAFGGASATTGSSGWFRLKSESGGQHGDASLGRVEQALAVRAGDRRSVASSVLSRAGRVVERALPMARSDEEKYREELSRAGWDLAPETWRGLRALSAGTGGFLAFAASASSRSGSPLTIVGFLILGAVVGWFLPKLALARGMEKRRKALEAQLPEAMDLLGIAIAAGSPVEQSFREVAKGLGQPLSIEFETVDREVNLLGHSREEALENLAHRCRSRDISSFVAQLTQAASQGSSIAESLASQAALARETAQAATIERIRKMPTKLDVVLSFCFLPPTVALVVVPTVVNLLKFLNDTLQ